MKSAFGKINLRDLLHGAFVAGAAIVSATIIQALNENHVPTSSEMLASLQLGAYAAVGYVVKKLVTNSDDKLLKSENSGDGN